VNRGTILIAAAALSISLLSGCKRDIQNTDEVKKGVLAYFSKRSDLLSMDVTVTNVVYREGEAVATVHLQAKGSNSPGSGMDMRYVLERKGNDWMVMGRAGGESHGAQGAPAGGEGSIGAMPQPLPPGHPSVPSNPPGQSK
jgi:hypothetical protein